MMEWWNEVHSFFVSCLGLYILCSLLLLEQLGILKKSSNCFMRNKLDTYHTYHRVILIIYYLLITTKYTTPYIYTLTTLHKSNHLSWGIIQSRTTRIHSPLERSKTLAVTREHYTNIICIMKALLPTEHILKLIPKQKQLCNQSTSIWGGRSLLPPWKVHVETPERWSDAEPFPSTSTSNRI